jgi:sarcosine oxidase subunit beta
MGASTAYHLAAAGASVVVLEAAPLFGTGSTGLNAGGIRHQFSTAVNIELSRLSIAMMERFEQEMGQPLDLNRCGYLFLLDNGADVSAFARNVALQHEHGVMTEWLSVEEIARWAPLLDLSGVVAGTFYDRDGLVDPSGLLQGYLAGARRGGARLLTSQHVLEIVVSNGRVDAAVTGSGRWSTGAIVLAAGAWSAEVARTAGIVLPVEPIRRQIAVTAPLEEIDRSFPFVIDFSRSLYFHYESGGILTGMSNPDQPPGFDTTVDPDWRLRHFEAAMMRLPLLERAGIVSEWAGLYEVTPDDQPILGALPHADGLYACCGFSGHGLMHGPAAGLLMAEEILNGAATTINISPLRWRDFSRGAAAAEYNVV